MHHPRMLTILAGISLACGIAPRAPAQTVAPNAEPVHDELPPPASPPMQAPETAPQAPVMTNAPASSAESQMMQPAAATTDTFDAQPGPSVAPPTRAVGGHVGVATPFVTISDETTSIADQFTLLNPIGIGVKVSDRVVIDFELVVATAIDPGGTTGLVVDPGIVYDLGGVALGLRIAWQINARGNVGLIPLANVPLVDFDGAVWFAEAAFPTFYSDETIAFNTVLHTGVGF